MKQKLATLLGPALLVAVVSTQSASADPGNGNSCLGAGVSFAAHQTQQLGHEGFGDFVIDAGVIPGQAIKLFEANTCDA